MTSIRFLRDENGAITPLLLVLFIGLVIISGAAIDLVKHEGERADIQDALDRGVLAAASLTQDKDPEFVVERYVASRNLDEIDVTPILTKNDVGVNSREIAAIADYDMPTVILSMAGLRDLDVIADSGAVQRRRRTEISLVLDISGTMRWAAGNKDPIDGQLSRIDALRPAAKTFIENTIGDTTDLVSINLIPYAGQTNPGWYAYWLMGGTDAVIDDPAKPETLGIQMLVDDNGTTGDLADDFFATTDRTCLRFNSTDFEATTLSPNGYKPVAEFHQWTIDEDEMDWGWCPGDRSRIIFAQSDKEFLKQRIDNLILHDGTGTYNGMRWAIGLLDPDSAWLFNALNLQQIPGVLPVRKEVPDAFSTGPVAWDEEDMLKAIVLMTDGQITEQKEIDWPNRPSGATLELGSDAHAAFQTVISQYEQDLRGTEIGDSGGALKSFTPSDFTKTKGETYFDGLCQKAAAKGVVIYTIAYQAPTDAQTQMSKCAAHSPEGEFFVAGTDTIGKVLETIAAEINNLKLTN